MSKTCSNTNSHEKEEIMTYNEEDMNMNPELMHILELVNKDFYVLIIIMFHIFKKQKHVRYKKGSKQTLLSELIGAVLMSEKKNTVEGNCSPGYHGLVYSPQFCLF